MPEPEAKVDSPETPEIDNEFPNEWMFRPCDAYKDEYDDCTSIKARFHQYFIFGEFLDCSQWKKDYHNCYLWQKYKSKQAYEELSSSEKIRRAQRLQGHYRNNVWEKRKEPPEFWNAPLPKWMEESFENTYLNYMNEQDKKGEIVSKSSSCTIL